MRRPPPEPAPESSVEPGHGAIGSKKGRYGTSTQADAAREGRSGISAGCGTAPPTLNRSYPESVTLFQRGYELSLRQGEIGPMAALAIKDFVKLELFQYVSGLGNGFRM